MPYLNYVQQLHTSFHGNRIFWNGEILQANAANRGAAFNHGISSWFYSGNLLIPANGGFNINPNLQFAFITMNPLDTRNPRGRLNHIANFNQFVAEMNSYLVNYRNPQHLQYRPIVKMYSKADRIIEFYLQHNNLGVQVNAQNNIHPHNPHPYLQQLGFCIDWFPFHSTGFKVNARHPYSIQLLQQLIDFLPRHLRIVALGKDVKDALIGVCNGFNIVQVPHHFHPELNGRASVISYNGRYIIAVHTRGKGRNHTIDAQADMYYQLVAQLLHHFYQ